MDFEPLTSGDIAAGGDAENWQRRSAKRIYHDQLRGEVAFRDQYIKTRTEREFSGSGWLLVKGAESFGK